MAVIRDIRDITWPWNESASSVFLSKPWFENFINTVLPDPRATRLITDQLSVDDPPRALLPAFEEVPKGWLGLRRLRSLSNYYSARFGAVALPSGGVGEAHIDGLVTEITRTRPRWDAVDLSPFVVADPELEHFDTSFRRHGWIVQQYFVAENWYHDTSGQSFDEFLAGRGKKIRKTAANRDRAFDRNPENSFEIVTDQARLDDALAVYERLYRIRWGRNEPYPGFIPGLARLCAEHGWLRLGVAKVDGIPAAVQFWIVRDGIAYIFKVAFDSQFNSMSIGSVALLKMFRHVIDKDRVRTIDFLTGDDAYKRDWMDQSRSLYGLAAFRTGTLKGLATGIAHLGRRRLRHLLRRN